MVDDARSGRSIRLWHMLVGVAGIGLLLLALLVVFLVIGSRNTAKHEAELLEPFVAETGSIHYCHNGYGKGIDNQTPWWEQTWVSDMAPADYVDVLGEALIDAGYEIETQHIVDSDDQYNRGKTYWELTGERNQRFTVIARVSMGEPTLNNCFEGFTEFTQGVDPADHESILVIKFRDEPA